MTQISNDLIEAYKGYYEREYEFEWDENIPELDEPYTEWCKNKIQGDSPKERLEVYLEWNGILGYTNRIWEIAQGEL